MDSTKCPFCGGSVFQAPKESPNLSPFTTTTVNDSILFNLALLDALVYRPSHVFSKRLSINGQAPLSLEASPEQPDPAQVLAPFNVLQAQIYTDNTTLISPTTQPILTNHLTPEVSLEVSNTEPSHYREKLNDEEITDDEVTEPYFVPKSQHEIDRKVLEFESSEDLAIAWGLEDEVPIAKQSAIDSWKHGSFATHLGNSQARASTPKFYVYSPPSAPYLDLRSTSQSSSSSTSLCDLEAPEDPQVDFKGEETSAGIFIANIARPSQLPLPESPDCPTTRKLYVFVSPPSTPLPDPLSSVENEASDARPTPTFYSALSSPEDPSDRHSPAYDNERGSNDSGPTPSHDSACTPPRQKRRFGVTVQGYQLLSTPTHSDGSSSFDSAPAQSCMADSVSIHILDSTALPDDTAKDACTPTPTTQGIATSTPADLKDPPLRERANSCGPRSARCSPRIHKPNKSPLSRSMSQPRVGVLNKCACVNKLQHPSRFLVQDDSLSPSGRVASPRTFASGLILGETSYEEERRKTIRRIKDLVQADKRRWISHSLTDHVQSAEAYQDNRCCIWVFRVLAFMAICIVANVSMLLFKLDNPFDPESGQYVFAYWCCPYATFFACTGVLLHTLAINKTPLPLWKVSVCSLIACVIIAIASPLMTYLNFYPIPYFPVTGGIVATGVAVLACIAFQPSDVRNDPVMRKKFPFLVGMVFLNVGSAFLYLFYVALFSSVEGNLQTMVAPLLTVVKVAVKHSAAFLARRLDNPDFVHGTALYTDLAGTCVSSIIFINVNALQTFLLLLAVDTALNLRHVLKILQVVTMAQHAKHQRIVRALCVSHRDPSLIQAAIHDLETTRLTAQIVECCGQLYFTELTESIVPLVMGFSAWIVYCFPNCNRQYITYMWQNSEEDFNKGMSYVMMDCGIQLVLFFGLTRYVQFKSGIPIAHVGKTLMGKDKYLIVWMMLGVCVYFFLIFIDHAGVDVRFKFEWLREGFNSTAQIVRKQRPCD